MRGWLAVLVLLLPAAGAELVIEDPAGDGGWHVGTTPTGALPETAQGGSVDILSLRARQDGPHLVVEVEQAGALREAQPSDIDTFLTIAGQEVTLNFWLYQPFDDGFFPVHVRLDDRQLRHVGYVDEERRVWGTRLLVHDLHEVGLEPIDGDIIAFRGTEAMAAAMQEGYGAKEYVGQVDRAPDDLQAEARLVLALAEKASGDLRLHAPVPFRSSNGAATVFVYDIQLENRGSSERQVRLAASESPEGWRVVHSSHPIVLGPGESETHSVLVALPSRHTHGEAESFLLRAEAQEEWAETRLGVQFPTIPEPSGHHPMVRVAFADSEDSVPPEGMDPLRGNFGFLNLSAAYIEPEGEPLQAHHVSGEWWWQASTERMGLGIDADLGSQGWLRGAVVSPAGMRDVDLSAAVFYGSRSLDGTAFAGTLGSAEVALGELPRDERVDFEVPLVPSPSADLVPPGTGGVLTLVLHLTGEHAIEPAREDHNLPHLAPGAEMRLPLLEYHDPVAELFGRGDDLRLEVEDTRRIVPGGKALFNVTLSNEGPAQRIGAQVVSVGDAQILGAEAFRLADGGRKQLQVALTAPESGQADAVFLVSSQDSADQRAAVLLRVVADPSGEDDAVVIDAFSPGGKSSPAPAVALVVALALLAVQMRPRSGR